MAKAIDYHTSTAIPSMSTMPREIFTERPIEDLKQYESLGSYQPVRNKDDLVWLKQELVYMEEEGIIREVTDPLEQSQIQTSPVFVIPKDRSLGATSRRSRRLIHDLRKRNMEIQAPEKFSLHTAQDIIHQLDWSGKSMMYIYDLASGYHHIQIPLEQQFRFGMALDNRLFVWTRMGFGLAAAPAYFQKTVQTLLVDRILDQLPHDTLSNLYLDDLLMQHRSLTIVDCVRIIMRFSDNNAKIAWNKSHIFGTRRAKYLGFIMDLYKKTVEIPPNKIEEMVNLIDKISTRATPLLNLKILEGKVSFYSTAMPGIPLYTRRMVKHMVRRTQQANIDECDSKYRQLLRSTYTSIPKKAKLDLLELKLLLQQSEGRQMISQNKEPQYVLYTDAAGAKGQWGAVLFTKSHQIQRVMGGNFGHKDTAQILNRELLALQFTLQHIEPFKRLTKVLYRGDNQAAISMLQNMRAKEIPHVEILKVIRKLLLEKRVFLVSEYVSTKAQVADCLTRYREKKQFWVKHKARKQLQNLICNQCTQQQMQRGIQHLDNVPFTTESTDSRKIIILEYNGDERILPLLQVYRGPVFLVSQVLVHGGTNIASISPDWLIRRDRQKNKQKMYVLHWRGSRTLQIPSSRGPEAMAPGTRPDAQL